MVKKIVPVGEYTNPVMVDFFKEFEKIYDTLVEINIFAETRYILYINDKYVAEGPCRGPKHLRYFDSLDIDKYLHEGKNVLRIRVFFQPSKRYFTSVFKGEKPSLSVSLRDKKSGDVFLETDKTWQCRKITSYKIDYNGDITRFMPPFEVVELPERYEEKKVEEIEEFSFYGDLNNVYGHMQEYEFRKRPISMIFPQDKKSLKIVKKGENFLELTPEGYVTAKLNCCFKTNKEVDVKIIYAEAYRVCGEKDVRDDSKGEISGPFDLIKINGEAKYSTFWFRAFRFIRIECEDIEKVIEDINYQIVHYPLDIQGSFLSSNEMYNKIYEISKTTLFACMHEIFVDCPFYEQQQYSMDTTLEAIASMQLSNDVELIKKAIYDIASSQNPDGLLAANAPCEYHQIIPGFQFFWIILLNEYIEYTLDFAFASEFIGTMCKILNYFSTHCDKDYLIPMSKYWNFVDWVEGWEIGSPTNDKSDSITVYNMMHVYALKCAENICTKCGMGGLASDFTDRRKLIIESINKSLYDEQRGLYFDSRNKKTYSQHTITWAVLADVVPEDKRKILEECLCSEDVLKCSFAMKFYVILALEKSGLEGRIFEIFNEWNTMVEKRTKTWWESTENPRSDCHAWSSAAPLYVLNRFVLGLKEVDNEKMSVVIKPPYDINLEYASGRIPTARDTIDIYWEKESGTIKVNVFTEKYSEIQLVLPNGKIEKFNNKIDDYIIRM